MSEGPSRRPSNTTGRKRDEERTDAILTAAADLLLEVGFERITTQGIAERAGAGKGAIYRRWATKEALLAEAIRNMPPREAPVTDDPIDDLQALVAERCQSAEEKPGLVPGLIAAMRSDQGIEHAVKEGYDLSYMRDTLVRILGPDHPHLDVLADITQAVPLFRAAFTPETINAELMTEEIISLVESLAATAPSRENEVGATVSRRATQR
ncbi:MAG: helix-turn-helix domain-containing protein [Acidimicrobiia bacterium]|nr:helix-turn-helix domain-containing protein [Acidimicrobiia bacterium]